MNRPPRILIVDDDPTTVQLLARTLAELGHTRFAASGGQALEMAAQWNADLVLLDAEMPGMNGFEVCETMKADEALQRVPVIFVTGHGQPEFEVAGFKLGAADFIAKPVNPSLVQARVKAQLAMKAMADELRLISATDALTGVANRRAFDEALAREWARGQRTGEPISLLMIDVDHFKRFNDRYGHPAGDACLRSVAQALLAVCHRPADLMCRFGGEEFALLLPMTGRAGAETVAAQVLDAVAALKLPHGDSPLGRHVSVSVGVGAYDEDSPCWVEPSAEQRRHTGFGERTTAAELLAAADAALYAAKKAGRARGCSLAVGDADTPSLARPVPPPPERQ